MCSSIKVVSGSKSVPSWPTNENSVKVFLSSICMYRLSRLKTLSLSFDTDLSRLVVGLLIWGSYGAGRKYLLIRFRSPLVSRRILMRCTFDFGADWSAHKIFPLSCNGQNFHIARVIKFGQFQFWILQTLLLLFSIRLVFHDTIYLASFSCQIYRTTLSRSFHTVTVACCRSKMYSFSIIKIVDVS